VILFPFLFFENQESHPPYRFYQECFMNQPTAMSSRQRVLASINHQQPDRVPVDLSGHRSSGISPIAYRKLRQRLGLPDKTIRVYDIVQQLAIVDEDVLEWAGVDTIELGRAFALEDRYWADWTLPDGAPCQVPAWSVPERQPGRWVIRSQKSGQVIAQMVDGSLYFEQTTWPFAGGRSERVKVEDVIEESMWTAIASPPGPITAGEDGYQVLAQGARKLRQSTDKAIIGLFGGNLLEFGQFMYRNDNFFMLLAGDPGEAEAFLDEITEMHLSNLEKYLGAVANFIDIILFGDDLGMQSGPQISPRMYRRFFKPRHAMLWQRAKELAPVKVMLHCCGGVRELLPDLIDAGLDAINPVQISCEGMETRGLKTDFGRELTFWGGGCDTRDVLPNAAPDGVYRHVQQQLEILSPGGGFVFQQVHNIQADIPPENIIAMYQAIKDF
jgi:uroporphyrinogen decarboxylase